MYSQPPQTPPRAPRTARATSFSLTSPWSSPLNNARYSPRKRMNRQVPVEPPPVPPLPGDFSARLGAAMQVRDKPRPTRTRLARLLRRPSRGFASRVLTVLLLGAAIVMLLKWGLYSSRAPLRIPKRHWDIQPYRHLDFSIPITLPHSTRIFHVAKEFGPATMGGLGVMLTALSIAQSESKHLSIAAITPHYSFLNSDPTLSSLIRPFTTLHVPIVDSRGRAKLITTPVSILSWQYSSMLDFLNPSLELDLGRDQRHIDMYLIGPGKESPFHVAFKAKDAGDVYSAYKPLKQEWKDLFFAKAVSELIVELNNPTKARTDGVRADVVQLHGATNAMVAYYLRHLERNTTRFGQTEPPAIIYSLHDTLDEVEYSNLVSNVATFAPSSTPDLSLSYYTHATQVFPSALGIDASDLTTFVSQSIAADIVEGRFAFNLQGLVMPSLSRKASEGAFVGISNGLDFTDSAKNPWTNDLLLAQGVAFPRVGEDVLDEQTITNLHNSIERSFVGAKSEAKRLLVQQLPDHFSSEDLTRPILLFIGRFQYNKGCEFFAPLLHLFSTSSLHNARLVLLGARNNFPHSTLTHLARQYPHHLTFIDDTTTLQAEWGPLIRMASDFAFVPSFSEAFGLVAAEGLLFGTPVISTGVGGLGEFLRPLRDDGSEWGNSHVFRLFDDPSAVGGSKGGKEGLRADQARPGKEQLEPAVRRCKETVKWAVEQWRGRQRWEWDERERFTRRMVRDALALGWSRDGGPIDQFVRVYQQAIETRRRNSVHVVVKDKVEQEDDQDTVVESNSVAKGESGTNPRHQVRGALPVYKVWTAQKKKEAVIKKIVAVNKKKAGAGSGSGSGTKKTGAKAKQGGGGKVKGKKDK